MDIVQRAVERPALHVVAATAATVATGRTRPHLIPRRGAAEVAVAVRAVGVGLALV